MTIKERLGQDQKAAMKSGDKARLGVIRMLRSKLQEAEVAGRGKHGLDYTLEDDEALRAIASYAKQRRESIEAYRQGGREELARAEEAELAIIQEYLPRQLGEDEIKRIVRAAVEATGAASPRDIGAVMKQVMPQLGGRADGKLVNRLVREALTGGDGS